MLGSCVQHPCWHRKRFYSGACALGRMQDKAKLVVHHVPACNPESLTRTRMEAISNYDLGVLSLVGSMSELCSNGSSSHLRIKAFFGTSENAVKSQIWIAVSVYVLVAI